MEAATAASRKGSPR